MAHVTAQDVFVDFPIYGAQSRSFKKALFRAATGGLIAREQPLLLAARGQLPPVDPTRGQPCTRRQ